MSILIEILGWLGILSFVVAYSLLSFAKVKSDSVLYQMMNLGGAIAVGISVYPKKAWPAFFLEVVWGSIALVSLLMIVRSKNQKL